MARPAGTQLVFPNPAVDGGIAAGFREQVWTKSVELATRHNRERSGRDSTVYDGSLSHAQTHRGSLMALAKTRADRATEFKGRLPGRVWEKQKRGLAHIHGVVSVESPTQLRWAEAHVKALGSLRRGTGLTSLTAGTKSPESSGQESRPPRTSRATSSAAGSTRRRDHRERPSRRPPEARRIHRTGSNAGDRMHDEEPAPCAFDCGPRERDLRVRRRSRLTSGSLQL